ncbi:hypothetical protein CPB83DRAFT_807430 [Crepidotus variabilis]|uniref:Zn(2)-C6 fungal-type domain-containing protein n=1 Tax=Crepidotus variabilis TaxID=179855 RepID=A0A9P6ENI3_9AGAR|nr:hypothetical protein CPB83DRAFT_807430 [Crepidotus variabilis]
MSFEFGDTKLFQFNDDGQSDSADTLDERQSQRSRSAVSGKPSGACVDCKSVKVRCEFVPGERKCRRCQAKNLPCHPRERKKRKAADTHEQLLERSHEQDLRIRNLLQQYEQLRTEQKIHQWMTKAPPSRNMMDITVQRQMKWAHKGKTPEQAVASYFATGNHPRSLSPPGIVKHCSLYPEDITELFSIYFARIDPYFSILDKDYHTAPRLLWTCPFLFTVVCAVSSRYYTARPNLYQVAMEFARDFAGNALIEGYRSVDVCQAYLIMAVYPVPKKKWVEDRSWLLMGVAIRMAIELELNQPPPPGCDAREALNRTRTWLNCYCVDGSHAIQFGKMPMLRLDDYIARNSADWYRSSSLNTPFDVHLCAYVQMILHMAKWREFTKCTEEPEEVIVGAMQMHTTIELEMDKWAGLYVAELTLMPLPICSYRANTSQMISAYLRLVVLLAAFQRSDAENLRRDSEIFLKSLNAARSVIQIATERLYPTGYLRYAMEANFLYMSFAAAFLLNLFRPRYIGLLDLDLKREIVSLVSRLISVLGSSDVALDGRHTPALYSRFLASLMSKHNLSVHQFQFDGENDPSSGNIEQNSRHPTPSNAYYWPDISTPDNGNRDSLAGSGTYGYQFGINQMDFSLAHFIKTVAETVPPPEKVESSPEWTNMDTMWNPQPTLWETPAPILAGWRM